MNNNNSTLLKSYSPFLPVVSPFQNASNYYSDIQRTALTMKQLTPTHCSVITIKMKTNSLEISM